MINEITFKPNQQKDGVSREGLEITVGGFRLSPDLWPEASLSPPNEYIESTSTLHIDLKRGLPVCVEKDSGKLQKYVYFVDWVHEYEVYKLIPSHGNANVIFMNVDRHDDMSEYIEYEQWLERLDKSFEAVHHSEISLYAISDEWLIDQLDKKPQVMAQAI